MGNAVYNRSPRWLTTKSHGSSGFGIQESPWRKSTVRPQRGKVIAAETYEFLKGLCSQIETAASSLSFTVDVATPLFGGPKPLPISCLGDPQETPQHNAPSAASRARWGYDSNGAKSNAKGCRLVFLAVSVRLRGGPRPSRSGTYRRG